MRERLPRDSFRDVDHASAVSTRFYTEPARRSLPPPADHARAAAAAFEQDTTSSQHAIDVLRAAHAADRVEQWTDARSQLQRALESATRSYDRARAHIHVDPEVGDRIAEAKARLDEIEATAASLTDPPRGFRAVSRESEIEAVLAAPAEQSIAHAFARKEAALVEVFEQLSVAESRILTERLRRPRPNDTVATLFHRMVDGRRQRLLRYLDGARQREARRVVPPGGAHIGGDRAPDSRRAPAPMPDVHAPASGEDAARPEPRPLELLPEQPLPYRSELERSFGRSFGHITAHTGVASALAPFGASALTAGNVVAFADQHPSPSLVAHEATHVIQNEQQGASVPPASGNVAPPDGEAEAEADSIGAQVAAHGFPDRFAPVKARSVGSVQLSAAPGVPKLRLDKRAEARALRDAVERRSQHEVLETLERNAHPEHMYALHRAYGSMLVGDVQGVLRGSSYQARARVYLGEQLGLHERIRARDGGDLDTILRDLERLTDQRALDLFEGAAGGGAAAGSPAGAVADTSLWLPAATSLAAIKAALRERLGADDYHRAIRWLLAKADRAFVARRARTALVPLPGQLVNPRDLVVSAEDVIADGARPDRSNPLALPAISQARVDAVEERVRAADAAGDWMVDARASSCADLALAELDLAERKLLALRLQQKPLANYLGGLSLQEQVQDQDDAAVIQRGIQSAYTAALLQRQAIQSIELDVAVARAGELIRRARARLARLPPDAPEAERAEAQAQATRLETMFYGPDSAVLRAVRLEAAQAGAEDPARGAARFESQMRALEADPAAVGAERLRGADPRQPTTLIEVLKQIPAPYRQEAMLRSGQADALWQCARSYTADQREQLSAYLFEGAKPSSPVAMADAAGASPSVHPAAVAVAESAEMIALPPELIRPSVLRPEAAIALHEVLDGMGRQAAHEVLARLHRLSDDDRRAVFGDPRFVAKLVTLPEDDEQARDFKAALQDAMKHGPAHALTNYPGPGGDGDVYQKVILEALGVRVANYGQARLRRAYVAVERLGGPDEIKRNPALLDDLGPDDRIAVRQLYGIGTIPGLAAELPRLDRAQEQQAAQDILFGQPQIGDTPESACDPNVEAEFMYRRLKTAARLRDDGEAMDLVSNSGASTDEALAEFMVLYRQASAGGVGRADLARLADLYHRALRRLDVYRTASESIAGIAAQITGAVVATVVVTIASGGALGPVAVGAMASLGAGAAAAAGGAALRIDSTATSFLKDLGTGAIEGIAATAGAGLVARVIRASAAGLPAGRAAAIAGAHATGRATGGIGTSIAEAAIDGAFGSAAGELFQTAVDEATWDRGIAEAFAAMLAAVARGAATGAGLGAGIGAVAGGVGRLARLATRAGDEAAAGVGRLLEASGVGTDILERTSELAEDQLVQVYRLIESGQLDQAEKVLAAVQGLPGRSRALLVEAARARVAIRTVGDLGPVNLDGVEIWPRVVEDREFRRLVGGERGDAVIEIENGRPQIVARRGAPAAAIREEITHLHQWQTDLAMRRRMAGLSKERLTAWDTMPADAKLGLHLDKLEIEADAQRRIIDQLSGRADADPEAASRVLDAEETLFELGQRIDALRVARGKPHVDLAELGIDDAPLLFAKGAQTPARIEGVLAARARANLGKSIEDADVQRRLRRLGYQLHGRDGTDKLFRIQRAPGMSDKLPHLAVDEKTGRIVDARPRADFQERRVDAAREWRRSGEDLTRLEADLQAGALSAEEQVAARRAYADAAPHVRAELDQRIIAGKLDEAGAGLLARWGRPIEELESRSASSSVKVTVRDLLATLPDGPLTETTLDNFRRLVRQRTIEQLMSIDDPAQRVQKLYEMIDVQPDNVSRGHLFSGYRQALMRGVTDDYGNAIFDVAGKQPRPFTGPDLRKIRTPDDEVIIRAQVENQLPGGKYAIEDKTGDGAFDIDQAEDYARRSDPHVARRQDGEMNLGRATGGFKRSPESTSCSRRHRRRSPVRPSAGETAPSQTASRRQER